jgi:GPH family glycoside/pentoside/hexuronide:cation symporter
VDEHELLFGARREGLFFAGLLFSVKAAAGLGGLFGGVALDLIGFPQNLAQTGAHLTLSPDVVTRLGIVHGPVPAVLGIAGAIALMGYRITRTELARIQGELASTAT